MFFPILKSLPKLDSGYVHVARHEVQSDSELHL